MYVCAYTFIHTYYMTEARTILLPASLFDDSAPDASLPRSDSFAGDPAIVCVCM